MEIMNNEVEDNTAGVLIFALPGLEKKDAERTNVHDNNIHDNNRDNFAAMGSTVSHVPVGTGILVLAAHDAEIHSNMVTNQDSVGLVMVSGATFTAIGGGDFSTDPAVNPYPIGDYIHDNTYTNCGSKPHVPLNVIPQSPVQNIVSGWRRDGRRRGEALPSNREPAELRSSTCTASRTSRPHRHKPPTRRCSNAPARRSCPRPSEPTMHGFLIRWQAT